MDTLPIVLLCPLVPAMCIVAALLIGGTSRFPRWKLGLALLVMAGIATMSIRQSIWIGVSEELWSAAARGDVKSVEKALAAGGSPTYSFEGQGSAIEIARKNGYEAIARRLERAVQQRG